MFQPHSILWHYLWVAPNLLLALLAGLLWKLDLHREFRAFFVYAWFQAIQWAVLYPMDLISSIPALDFWRVCTGSLLLESIIVLVLISDIFASVFGSYAALAQLGKNLIRWAGAVLLVTATAIGTRAPVNEQVRLVSASHIMEETMNLMVAGLILLLFISAAYFRLAWKRGIFGIALGLGVNACIYLATWAILANGGLPESARNVLNLVNMATSHVVVMAWFYYLLVPAKLTARHLETLPENNLALWNRELERLLQQ